MSSTILSSLGEPVLHRNSLATITDNWIIVREVQSHKQVLLSIDSISSVKKFKTIKIHNLTCALGALLVSVATACSKESYGATLPFALVGVALLISAQASRKASLAFIADREVIQTAYGTLPEAATLMTAIRSARNGSRWRNRAAYELLVWWQSYITMLV